MKIVSVCLLPGEGEYMQCITVNSPDHTFVCGDFIVTHNTWLEVYIGAQAELNDYRVLQLVTEMSDEQMRDRYEAMLYSMCYGELNYGNFKRGRLDLKTEKKYFQFLEDDLPNFEPLQVASVTGVMSVSAAIEKYKPDIVLIDSVYLMDDDQGGKDDWLRVAHITRDLKKLCKRVQLPIFINSQADKSTSKRTGPDLGNISYSQAIGQDSDCVLAMFRDETMIADKEMGIKVLKQREGECGTVFMTWDFDTMDFNSLYSERESGEVSGNDDDSDSKATEKGVGKNTLDLEGEDE
jgi:replicative DNA helicase